PPSLPACTPPPRPPGDSPRICRPIAWSGLTPSSPLYVQAFDGNPLGVGFGPVPPEVPRTSIGWPVQPEAFRATLLAIHKRYGLPVYVLENGTANADEIGPDGNVTDQSRIDFLNAYTTPMFEAIRTAP